MKKNFLILMLLFLLTGCAQKTEATVPTTEDITTAEEVKESVNAGKLLGGAKPQILHETLTGEEVRTFVITKKISQTPPKYPRVSAKISKQPL